MACILLSFLLFLPCSLLHPCLFLIFLLYTQALNCCLFLLLGNCLLYVVFLIFLKSSLLSLHCIFFHTLIPYNLLQILLLLLLDLESNLCFLLLLLTLHLRIILFFSSLLYFPLISGMQILFL